MNRVLFSIIVPAYNVGRYVEACILSIVHQSIETNKYEVIVVNDGSLDDTESKVRELCNEYKNVFLFNQENAHIGGARNTGISHSHGEYIIFLDADDMFIYQNTLDKLREVIELHHPDYIHCPGFQYIPSDAKVSLSSCDEAVVMEVMTAEVCVASPNFSYSACNYIYKRDLFEAENVRFAERCSFEELDFCVRALYAKGSNASVIKIGFPYYGYRENPVSITRRPNVQLWLNNLMAIERLLAFIRAHFDSPSSAMQACLKRCQSDMTRKPWHVFRLNFSYSECREFHRRWLEVLSAVQKIGHFREWVSAIPLCVFFTYGVMYRAMRKLKHMIISK